ncbi:MAG TPA: FAD-dependent oxidoreductase [Rhizomicrobium sp.]
MGFTGLSEFSTARRNFAVVGSGIAGMSAAWLLSKTHNVTVYEREAWIGGHSHTVDVESARGPVAVDTGFIVYNEANYPNLTALFRHLAVPTKRSCMEFSVSLDDGAFEYAGNLQGLVAQPACLMRADYWAMLRDTLRFYREAPHLTNEARRMNLGDFLDWQRYSKAFAKFHLLPMGAAIWSSSIEDMRAHPLRAFLRFFENHGLMKLSRRPQWRTVDGGSREYVTRLTAAYKDKVRTGSGVRAILRDGGGVTIIDTAGERRRYDGVIVAAHADQALTMLDDASSEERRLLGAFKYRPNQTVLHNDPTLMPKRRRAWASWNYIGKSDAEENADLCVSYYMNKLQGIDAKTPLFVTLNPQKMPHDSAIFGTWTYQHPVFDAAALDAQERLWTLQGANRTWFCGSYFGSGFHEDALQAGLAAAEAAGSVRRPWQITNESGRIVLAPSRQPVAA